MRSSEDPRPHVLTVRIPRDLFLALRDFAFYTERSMNECLVSALRSYLAAHGSDDELKAMVDEARRRFHRTIEDLDPGDR